MLEKKLKILEEVFGDYTSTNTRKGKEYLFYCPKCKHHKKKLSFNIEKNYFKCWICLWSSKSIFWAIKTFGNYEQVNDWNILNGIIDFSTISSENEPEIKISLPDEYISLATHKPSPLTLNARLYLKNRGITFQDILWWKMGVCLEGKYKNRIIIPSFGLDGKCNFFVARSFDDHPIPYLNPPLNKDIIFNELFIDWNKEIILTEGVFDGIVAHNFIPLLGSSIREESNLFQKIVSRCPKLFIALDPDASEKEKDIINTFLMYGTQIFKIPIKPFKDLGSMSRKQFKDRKDQAVEITKDNQIEILLRE